MRQKLVLLGLFLAVSIAAVAQDIPKVEIFGGYSFLRTNPGGGSNSANANGWNASASLRLQERWAFKADFDGHYCCNGQTEHNFLLGPQFTVFRRHSSKMFVHGMVGASLGTAPASSFGDTALAWVVGGGLDVSPFKQKRIGLRLAQVDYLGTHYGDESQHNIRYSGGVVFRFGK